MKTEGGGEVVPGERTGGLKSSSSLDSDSARERLEPVEETSSSLLAPLPVPSVRGLPWPRWLPSRPRFWWRVRDSAPLPSESDESSSVGGVGARPWPGAP